MQRDRGLYTGKASPGHGYELGGQYTYDLPLSPPFGANQEAPVPLDRFEFQPYENCPKNFIIFDQTDNRGRVMFHPALAHKFNSPNLNNRATYAHEEGKISVRNGEKDDKISSLIREDTEDIDALLNSEEDEEDDVISTGRTPDSSFLAEGFKSRKMECNSRESFSSSSRSSGRKRERMRKMVKALREIIPGGEHMDTPSVLDEAVRYLESLKVEAKQLGIQNFTN